jgi:galactokinase
MAVLKKEGAEFLQGYTVEISGDVPVNAGVSSSSALVVAWIRFLLQAQEAPWTPSDKQIGQWAYQAEVLYFGQPGGLMDQFTIAQRGMLYIDTKNGETTPLTAAMGTLILAESGISKQTLEVLQNARTYAQNALEQVKKVNPDLDIHKANEEDYFRYLKILSPVYQPYWYATIHNHLITQSAKKELMRSSPDSILLGKLMDAHQKILQQCIQNTPEPMRIQMEAAQKAGALGTKIIGSGGGGCMVAVVEEQLKDKVIAAFKNAGARDAYQVHLTS